MTPRHHPASQGRKGTCGCSVSQSQALLSEYGPDEGHEKVWGIDPAEVQPPGNPLLAGTGQSTAAPVGCQPSRMATGCQGEGEYGPVLVAPEGPTCCPSPQTRTLRCSEPQGYHCHLLLLLLLPGRQSYAEGSPWVNHS